MANWFTISNKNPLKFYNQYDLISIDSVVFNPQSFDVNINNKGIDEDFTFRSLKDWQDKTKIYQPFQNGDFINIQFIGIEPYSITTPPTSPYKFRLIDCNGKIFKNETCIIGSTLPNGDVLYQSVIFLWDIPEGIYFCQIYLQGTFGQFEEFAMISEPIEVKLTHENSSLITYKNSHNESNLFYETGVIFQYRFHGYITEVNPLINSVIYEDDGLNSVLLSAKNYREYTLEIGGNGKYVNQNIIDKISNILASDSLNIEGKYYTISEGAKIEITRNTNSQIVSAKVPLRDSENSKTIKREFPNVYFRFQDQSKVKLKGGRFYVDTITFLEGAAGPMEIKKHFKDVQEFLNYFNQICLSNFILPFGFGNVVFTTNLDGNLIAKCSTIDAFTFFNFGIEVDIIIESYIELDIIGNGYLQIDVTSVSNENYFIDFGDNTKDFFYNTTNETIIKNYTSNKPLSVYFFMSNAESMQMSSSTCNIKNIGGYLPKDLFTFDISNNSVQNINNNLFLQCNGNLSYINLYANNMSTNTINTLIMYLFDAINNNSLSNTIDIDLSLQTPLAPPTISNNGIQNMMSFIKYNTATILTD